MRLSLDRVSWFQHTAVLHSSIMSVEEQKSEKMIQSKAILDSRLCGFFGIFFCGINVNNVSLLFCVFGVGGLQRER